MILVQVETKEQLLQVIATVLERKHAAVYSAAGLLVFEDHGPAIYVFQELARSFAASDLAPDKLATIVEATCEAGDFIGFGMHTQGAVQMYGVSKDVYIAAVMDQPDMQRPN